MMNHEATGDPVLLVADCMSGFDRSFNFPPCKIPCAKATEYELGGSVGAPRTRNQSLDG